MELVMENYGVLQQLCVMELEAVGNLYRYSNAAEQVVDAGE